MGHVISGRFREDSASKLRFVFEAFTPDETAAGFRRDV
jgi:hypothetical protein